MKWYRDALNNCWWITFDGTTWLKASHWGRKRPVVDDPLVTRVD